MIKRLKPYKATSPIRTINQIREILEGIEIIPSERYEYFDDSGFCYTRVHFDNYDFGEYIGTNGKGMHKHYAYASCYAELMERLQNRMIFADFKISSLASESFIKNNPEMIDEKFTQTLRNKGLILDFLHSPDEILLNEKELEQEYPGIIKYFFGDTKNMPKGIKHKSTFDIDDKILCVPFYDVKRNKQVHLPISYMDSFFTSNGMCAGNTYEEALIQGICEVMERYALKKIYTERLTPPSIPVELFEGNEIFHRIKKIESQGTKKIIIKDCSLGVGLPVIGVIIVDYDSCKYTFRLGSDPSPITALERCLTEIYQGPQHLKYTDLSIIYKSPFENESGIFDNKIFQKNFFNSCHTGSGAFPENLFGNKASYDFKGFTGFNPESKSDKEDLKFLTNLLLKLGFNLFVRDVSFLGFPSFRVFIPEMSKLTDTFGLESIGFLKDFHSNINTLLNLKHSSDEKIKNLVESLKSRIDNVTIANFNLLPLNFYNISFIFDTDFLMAILYYRIADYKSSFDHLDKYIKRCQKDQVNLDFSYYYCLRDFVKLKADNIELSLINERLSIIYTSEIVREVAEDLSNPKDVFKSHKLPSCFKCEQCEVAETCNFFSMIKITKTLQKKHKSNLKDQMMLKKVFE